MRSNYSNSTYGNHRKLVWLPSAVLSTSPQNITALWENVLWSEETNVKFFLFFIKKRFVAKPIQSIVQGSPFWRWNTVGVAFYFGVASLQKGQGQLSLYMGKFQMSNYFPSIHPLLIPAYSCAGSAGVCPSCLQVKSRGSPGQVASHQTNHIKIN